ncbi:MAG: OmpA family protein [Proteobacteria bacterium]|nr:OmpA family protein [Pseudomonadota bacterium]
MNKLLFFIIIISLPVMSSALCIDYKTQINQSLKTKNFDQLKKLLPLLENEGCASNYISALQSKLAQMVSLKADELVMAGDLEQARSLLQRASSIVNWETQIIRADIVAFEGNWQEAAKLYNQALDLINDPKATPKAPSTKLIQKIFQLASEAQILAGTLDGSRYSEHGVIIDNVRGFKPDKILIPVKFEFNKSTLSAEGKQSALHLLEYIKQHDFKKITLIGHTDAKGSEVVNDKISMKRALTLKNYLKKSGINIPITAIGQGMRTPLILDGINKRYTESEIDDLNRRVEVITE